MPLASMSSARGADTTHPSQPIDTLVRAGIDDGFCPSWTNVRQLIQSIGHRLINVDAFAARTFAVRTLGDRNSIQGHELGIVITDSYVDGRMI